MSHTVTATMKIAYICVQLLLVIFFKESTTFRGKYVSFSRQKRYLVWKEGINWVQLIVGVGLPVELRGHSITLGSVIKAYYLLPTNSTDYTQPSIDIQRRKRSTRWKIYKLLEDFLDRFGHGSGKECLLREICETALRPLEVRSGLLSEIVQAVLTPSSTQELLTSHLDNEYLAAEKLGNQLANCSILFPDCKVNFMKQFTKNIQ